MPPKHPMNKITKMQMKKARGFIELNQLDEARKLLIGIDHPTAERWLEQLKKHQSPTPAENVKPKKKRSILAYLVAIAFACIAMAMAGMLVDGPAVTPSPETVIRRAITNNADGSIYNARYQNSILTASFFTTSNDLRALENQLWAIACEIQSADIPADEYNLTAWENEETWLATASITPDEMQTLDCGEDAERIGRQIEYYETN